jgi:hypothetical protein
VQSINFEKSDCSTYIRIEKQPFPCGGTSTEKRGFRLTSAASRRHRFCRYDQRELRQKTAIGYLITYHFQPQKLQLAGQNIYYKTDSYP